MFTPYFGGPVLAYMKRLVILKKEQNYNKNNLYYKPYFSSPTDLLRALFFLQEHKLAKISNLKISPKDYGEYKKDGKGNFVLTKSKKLNKPIVFTPDKFKKAILNKYCDCDLLNMLDFEITISKKDLKNIDKKIIESIDNVKGLKNSAGTFKKMKIEAQKDELLEYFSNAIGKYNTNNIPFKEKEIWPKFWETNGLIVLLDLEREGFIKINRIQTKHVWCNIGDASHTAESTTAIVDINKQKVKKIKNQSIINKIGGKILYQKYKGVIIFSGNDGIKIKCDLKKGKSDTKTNWQQMIFDTIWDMHRYRTRIKFQLFKEAMEDLYHRKGGSMKGGDWSNIKRALDGLQKKVNKKCGAQIIIIERRNKGNKKREFIHLVKNIKES